MIKDFQGDPNTYFEKLIHLNHKLKELGAVEDVQRDLKCVSYAIMKYALREDATDFEKTWREWLTVHKRTMLAECKIDSLVEMQWSSRAHKEEMKRLFPAGAGKAKGELAPAMFYTNGYHASSDGPSGGSGGPWRGGMRGGMRQQWGSGRGGPAGCGGQY
eukprot:2041381-Rhodomonas_salina.1